MANLREKRGRWPLQWFVGPDWCCMLCTYTLVLVPTVAFIIFIGEHHWAARYGAVLTGGATLVAFVGGVQRPWNCVSRSRAARDGRRRPQL